MTLSKEELLLEKEITAIHEAGHCVIAYLFGRAVEYIRISENLNTEGLYGTVTFYKPSHYYRMAYKEDPNPSNRRNLIADSLLMVAGYVAAELHTSDDVLFDGSADKDLEMLYMNLEYLSDSHSEHENYHMEFQKRVSHLFGYRSHWKAPWRAVHALSQELMKSEFTSGEDAEHIIRSVLGRSPLSKRGTETRLAERCREWSVRFEEKYCSEQFWRIKAS